MVVAAQELDSMPVSIYNCMYGSQRLLTANLINTIDTFIEYATNCTDVPAVQARRGFEASWLDNLTEINGEGAKEELLVFLAQLNTTNYDAGSDTEEEERNEGDPLLEGADE